MIPVEENELKTLTVSYLVVTNPATGESAVVVTSANGMFTIDLAGKDATAFEDMLSYPDFWVVFFNSVKEALPVV